MPQFARAPVDVNHSARPEVDAWVDERLRVLVPEFFDAPTVDAGTPGDTAWEDDAGYGPPVDPLELVQEVAGQPPELLDLHIRWATEDVTRTSARIKALCVLRGESDE